MPLEDLEPRVTIEDASRWINLLWPKMNDVVRASDTKTACTFYEPSYERVWDCRQGRFLLCFMDEPSAALTAFLTEKSAQPLPPSVTGGAFASVWEWLGSGKEAENSGPMLDRAIVGLMGCNKGRLPGSVGMLDPRPIVRLTPQSSDLGYPHVPSRVLTASEASLAPATGRPVRGR